MACQGGVARVQRGGRATCQNDTHMVLVCPKKRFKPLTHRYVKYRVSEFGEERRLLLASARRLEYRHKLGT